MYSRNKVKNYKTLVMRCCVYRRTLCNMYHVEEDALEPLFSPRRFASLSWFRLPRMRSVFLRSISVISPQFAIRETVPSRPITMGPSLSSATAAPLTSMTVLSPSPSPGAGRAGSTPTAAVGLGDGVADAGATSSTTVSTVGGWAAGAGPADGELPGSGDVLAAEDPPVEIPSAGGTGAAPATGFMTRGECWEWE